MEEYEKLKRLVDDAADDVFKAVGGNKAAGTRVRKTMQDIRNTAQAVRQKILDLRKAEEQGVKPAGADHGEPRS
ncbi:MAG TPA: histone H1 [Phycisphaerae bacterium]|nr:histone H1 [Phycisphaerae bacterium]